MWLGNPANIPGGWALCDGSNGTPNMVASWPGLAGIVSASNSQMHFIMKV
jgi:hypothetical protein